MPGEFDTPSNDFDMTSAASEVAAGLGFGGPDEDLSASAAGTPADDAPLEETGTGEETPEASPAAEQPAASAAPAPAATAAPAPIDLSQPPKTWRRESTGDWAALPETVRAEIHKREQDMYTGLEQYREGAKLGWEVQNIFKPYEPVLQQYGILPTQILPGLLKAHATLSLGAENDKLGTIEQLIKDYRIPVPTLLAKLTGGALEGAEPFIDPQVRDLRAQVEALNSRLQEQDRRDLQARQAEVNKQVATFASDPANIYFEELADDIAALIRGGVTKDIKVAYEKALWANPVVRAKEQARIAQAAETERSRKATEAAATARKATAANVRSTARTGNLTAAKPTSIDDTLNRTLAEIQSRAN